MLFRVEEAILAMYERITAPVLNVVTASDNSLDTVVERPLHVGRVPPADSVM